MILNSDSFIGKDKKEVIKAFVDEYRQNLAEMRKNVVPQPPYVPQPMGEPIWVQILKERRERFDEARHWLKLDAIDFFVTRYELNHFRIDYGQRVENPRTGDYVDWWVGKKQRMRRVNGEFCHQGLSQKNLFRELVLLAIQ